ncbi:MAG: glutamate mutase L [Actinobacteria bacterium]|nr:glutamate mutase L [Actinomycetota bacterium]MBI3686271.1 glutamate mutase L [Actinomycetota bacterium]
MVGDIGSTYTKLVAVEAGTGRLLATAAHPTTVGGDVLDGYDAARTALLDAIGGPPEITEMACSSAGGGLRLAVVGQERLISAEAGHRVALSAGARVVAVTSGRLDADRLRELRAASPDVILLVGGTDGGDELVLRHNAGRLAGARLAGARLAVPLVVAGNVAARDDLVAMLRARGRLALPTANVLPDIGVLDPQPARAVIRQVFLDHVIGGKRLSRQPRFGELVRAVTPDAVLDGVTLLARTVAAADETAGDVLVVDVGGATTDVYSAVNHPGEEFGPARQAVAELPDRRTVEADLGVRWSAPGVLDAAAAGGLAVDDLAGPAARRAADPALLPLDPGEASVDLRLATLAATIAVRRHHRQVAGHGLHGVTHVVISGGVFRHAPAEARQAALASLRTDPVVGTLLGSAGQAIDGHYVLAAAGLLARVDPRTGGRLLRRYLIRPGP